MPRFLDLGCEAHGTDSCFYHDAVSDYCQSAVSCEALSLKCHIATIYIKRSASDKACFIRCQKCHCSSLLRYFSHPACRIHCISMQKERKKRPRVTSRPLVYDRPSYNATLLLPSYAHIQRHQAHGHKGTSTDLGMIM